MDYSKLTKVTDSQHKISDSDFDFNALAHYDYYKEVEEDIEEYIMDNYNGDLSQFADADEAYETLYDELWTADSVTGNGSGSYFFNTAQSAIAVGMNWDMLKDACDEFGGGLPDGPEAADVTIRCYVLGQVLAGIVGKFIEAQSESEEVGDSYTPTFDDSETQNRLKNDTIQMLSKVSPERFKRYWNMRMKYDDPDMVDAIYKEYEKRHRAGEI